LRTLDTKQHILDDAGFTYNFDRAVYFNRKSKKVISVEYAQDSDEEVLERATRDDNGGGGWRFYFNFGDPPEAVKREIEAALGCV
jgi:hypothetical protein